MRVDLDTDKYNVVIDSSNLDVSISDGGRLDVNIGESAKIDIQEAITYIKSGEKEIDTYVKETVKPDILEYSKVESKKYIDSYVSKTVEEYVDEVTIPSITEFSDSKIREFNSNAVSKTDDFNTLSEALTGEYQSLAQSSEEALVQYVNSASASASSADASLQSASATLGLVLSAETRVNQTEQDVKSYGDSASAKYTEFNTNAESKLNAYNSNASSKLSEYNSNATSKVNAYDTNATTKLNAYNSNDASKVSAYDTNAKNKLDAYNSNATTLYNKYVNKADELYTEYNSNAESKVEEYDTNASSKLSTYNTNADSKLSSYNSNATTKLNAYNTNAETTLESFNANAVEKNAIIDEKVSIATSKSQVATDKAGIATTKASEALSSANRSEQSAKNSSDSAEVSLGYATSASQSASSASLSASNASKSEANSKTSETNAKTSEVNAKSSETKASQSATSASNSATTATNKAKEAGDYATECANIKNSLGTVYTFRGSVATVSALPTNASVGDVYDVVESGINYAWTGSVWDSLGLNVDLSQYAKKTDLDTKQDKLTSSNAGTGIKIENGVISNTQTSANWGNITGTLSSQTDLQNALNSKQATISDLSTIRTGASLGSTAIQPNNIKTINGQSLVGSGDVDVGGISYEYLDEDVTVNPESIREEWEAFKTSIFSTLYPVGSIYIGEQDVCPMASLITGSVWELVANDRVLQGSGTNVAGSTIEAGLPNITGTAVLGDDLEQCVNVVSASGAFSGSSGSQKTQRAAANNTNDQSTQVLNFSATKSSSIYGNSTTVQPPAYVVNIWKRTA